ncbi:hypothetical protein N7510_010636 [Penicillium lagena]|uniref:uncharacterized protein n=1 Tax=Penicillium lagena TaxID=94218 RepID=UPI0025411064|nr:uncharacterized protein N7510_010636 [Penicillium lagena]KAJ5601102.1 hypothetical protein N7510_010636 [Penicillium lagena]
MKLPNSILLALLAALPAYADGLYSKKSPVLNLNQKTYSDLIAKSNYTSLLFPHFGPTCRYRSSSPLTSSSRFYAPWCGHCQNLKPAYEKAAKNLNGLAKVAAVNCDDDENKAFCGQLGVQGFPTLKIVTPGKKPGKPRVEDYKGARTAKGIVDAVVDQIPNHVKRATNKDLDKWLAQNEDRPKAILFTEKGSTSALVRALAIDFLGSIDFAQVRDKETELVDKYDITEFPTLVLVPADSGENKVYNGEMKKLPITAFLSLTAKPNPDALPGALAEAAASAAGSKAAKPTPTADDDSNVEGAESKPAQVPIATPPIPTLATAESLESSCLAPKSGTCVLALLPEPSEADAALPAIATDVLANLAEIAHKHAQRGTKLFPLYAVPAINTGSKTVRDGLGLANDQTVQIVALNARRGWWRQYGESEDFGLHALEAWVDALRLGEGAKEKLPEGLVVESQAEPEHDEL